MGELAIINKALELPRIREQKEEDLYKPFVILIGRIHALKGIKLEADDLRFMAREFARAVFERFSGLTIEEISVALDKGVKKDFGDYYGLNVITFIDWVRAYQQCEARVKAINERYKATLPESIPPTPEERNRRNIEADLRLFGDYLKTGEISRFDVYNAMIYDDLDQRGLISQANEAKWAAIRKAEQLIGKTEEAGRTQRNGQIESVGSMIKDFTPPTVINKAKAIILSEFFSGLVQDKKDLSELLHTKGGL